MKMVEYNTVKKTIEALVEDGAIYDSIHDIREELEHNLETHPLYLGCGISRVVFILNEQYIVKYNYSTRNTFGGNIDEYTIYRHLSQKYGKNIMRYFAIPLYISHDQKYLVMQRMTITLDRYKKKCTVNERRIIESKVDDMNQELKNQGIRIDDLHGANIMVNGDGEPVIVDYAINGLRINQDIRYNGFSSDFITTINIH